MLSRAMRGLTLVPVISIALTTAGAVYETVAASRDLGHLDSRSGPRCRRMLMRFASVLGLLAAAVFAALAPAIVAPAVAQQQPGPIDTQEVRTFLDGLMGPQMEAHHIPGATVAIVKDGQVRLAQGYGSADVERGTPVVADRTLFRVGSVAKLFVGTAVMQLAEQNKVDLHADVNTYLTAFKVPDTYPGRPVTLAHLLTHTAGFEEHTGALARSASELQPLGVVLANNLPARVRPPGELTAYSNHGVSLAAYVVEQVAGQPFEQYVQQYILQPLEMRRSTYSQPPAPDLLPDVAVGYTYSRGAYRAEPFEFVGLPAAGSVSATAPDIANFMVAQLQDGRFGDARILQSATAQEMHRRQFTLDPRLDGMAYSFWEQTIDDQRVLRHDGDTGLFHSMLAILPVDNVGLFVSYDSAGGAEARDELLHGFLDHYYAPTQAPAMQPLGDTLRDADQVAGAYLPTRRAYTTWTKASSLFATPVVTATAADRISLTLRDAGPEEYQEIAPLIFRRIDGWDTVAFRADDQRPATHLIWTQEPVLAWERAAWYEDPRLHLPLLAACGLVFVSTLLAWPIIAGVRRLRRRSAGHGQRLPALARWIAGVTCLVDLGVLIGLVLVAGSSITQQQIVVVIALGLLAAVLTLAVVVCIGLAWRQRYWGVFGRLYYTLVTFAALAFLWDLNYWNLLGFHF